MKHVLNPNTTLGEFLGELNFSRADVETLVGASERYNKENSDGRLPDPMLGFKVSRTKLSDHVKVDGKLVSPLDAFENKKLVDLTPYELKLLFKMAKSRAAIQAMDRKRGHGVGDNTESTVRLAIKNLNQLEPWPRPKQESKQAPKAEMQQLELPQVDRECNKDVEKSTYHSVQERINDLTKAVELLSTAVQNLQKAYAEENTNDWGRTTPEQAF